MYLPEIYNFFVVACFKGTFPIVIQSMRRCLAAATQKPAVGRKDMLLLEAFHSTYARAHKLLEEKEMASHKSQQ